MSEIIDATNRFEERRKTNELQQLQKAFMRLFGHCTRQELQRIKKLIESGDEKAYKEFTEPILMRKAIKDWNSL
jgi:hypothetical protein